MKAIVGHIIVALLLAAAGGVCWMLGGAERRVAEGHQALATMRYAAVADSAGELAASLGLAGRTPRIGEGMTSAVQEDRSTAEYWLVRYDALAPQRDGSGAVIERDAAVLLVAANAAYRALDLTADPQVVARHLNGVITSYAEVLKSGAGAEDAAYNYEFVVRRRDALARGAAAPQKAGTTPRSASIHGRLGAPPRGADMSSFKTLVPRRSDEREDELKRGAGDVKKRKG